MMSSIDEVEKYLKEALEKASAGIIIETPDYIYALYELSGNRWRQVSYVFSDGEGYVEEIDIRRALLLLIEEVSKSLAQYNKGEWRIILSEIELEEVLEKARK